MHYYSIGSAASYDLHNIPFAYKINATAQDYTSWDVFEFEFCGQVSSFLPWTVANQLTQHTYHATQLLQNGSPKQSRANLSVLHVSLPL